MTAETPDLGCVGVNLRAPAELNLPRDPGYLLLAAISRAVTETPGIDPALRRRLHDGRPKPFALSPLALRRDDGGLVADWATAPPGAALWVRWSALDSPTLDAIERILAWCRDGHPFHLSDQPLRVEQWAPIGPPGRGPGGMTTYAAILAGAQPVTEVALRFVSPFAVRSGTRVVPLDQIETRHVFNGYVERWQAFAPRQLAAIPGEAIVAATRLRRPPDLRLAPRPRLPSKAPWPAYLGVVHFDVEGDAALRRIVSALADYAWYCGSGAATAFGRGVTERVV